MGFYGNLTNTARTQFQFDKIYPNRYTMERNIDRDGIYLNRYVLVEYDQEIREDSFKVAYLSDGKFYTTMDCSQEYVFNTFVAVASSSVNRDNFQNYYVENNGFHYPASGYDAESTYYSLNPGGSMEDGVEENEVVQIRTSAGYLTGEFYYCTGPVQSVVSGTGEIITSDKAAFTLFLDNTLNSITNNYFRNYYCDIGHYGQRAAEGTYSRAWDSTVWQKVYSHGTTKYIMIAELNSSAPGFSMVFDAPTQTPLAPHVDGSSGNNTYRVHLQPTWGFRIKEEENAELSDEKVTHITSSYDSKRDNINDTVRVVNGAIYYNKAGFDINYSKHADSEVQNSISFSPTGKGGLKYNSHLGYFLTKDTSIQEGKIYYTYDAQQERYIPLNSPQVGSTITTADAFYEYGPRESYDVNELSISLPVIGDAVANFYDLMYGYNHENDLHPRYRNTEWRYVDENTEHNNGGHSSDITTLAGSINHVHELTGEILKKIPAPLTDQEAEDASSDLIYYLPKEASNSSTPKYYYRTESYDFDTSVIQYSYVRVDKSTEPYYENCYYVSNTDLGATVGAAAAESSLQEDIGNTEFANNKYYYKRIIESPTYSSVGELLDYETDHYYYKLGKNYYVDSADNFSQERDYYELDSSFQFITVTDRSYVCGTRKVFVPYNLISSVYKPIFPNPPSGAIEANWRSVSESTFLPDKTYYTIGPTGRLIEYSNSNYAINDPIPNDRIICDRFDASSTTTINDIIFDVSLQTAVDEFWVEDSVSFPATYDTNTFYYFGEETDGRITYSIDTTYPFTQDRVYYRNRPTPLTTNHYLYYSGGYYYIPGDKGSEVDPEDPDYVPIPNTLEGFLSTSHADPVKDNGEFPSTDIHYWSLTLGDPISIIDGNGQVINVSYQIIGASRVEVESVTGEWSVAQYNIYGEVESHQTGLLQENGTFIYEYETPVLIKYYYKHKLINNEVYYRLGSTTSADVFKGTYYNIYYLNIDENTPTYTNDDFYVADKYYYINERYDLILDTNRNILSQYPHFILPEDETTHILDCMLPVLFYEPDKYYYQAGSAWIQDSSAQTTANREYFEKDIYRVKKDLLGYYSAGSPWNSKLLLIPCTITLGLPVPVYKMKEMGDVGTEQHSINGLILKYNKLLDLGDNLTRENSTVQGVVNTYKDIISRFDSDMESNKLLITDFYGRVTSSDYSVPDILDYVMDNIRIEGYTNTEMTAILAEAENEL